VPGFFEPLKLGAGGDLTPTHGEVAGEGEEAGWGTLADNFAQRSFIDGSRIPAVVGTNAPVHAPAALTRTGGAEKIDEGGKEIGGECEDLQRETGDGSAG